MDHPTPKQLAFLKPFFRGKTFVDFGCGHSFSFSKFACDCNAKGGLAIDKERSVVLPEELDGRIDFRNEYFCDIKSLGDYEGSDVGILSWIPQYNVAGLVDLISNANLKYLVYFGESTSGSACCGVDLWRYLTKRQVIHSIPELNSSLILYGRELTIEEQIQRKRLWEEEAGLDQNKIFNPVTDFLP